MTTEKCIVSLYDRDLSMISLWSLFCKLLFCCRDFSPWTSWRTDSSPCATASLHVRDSKAYCKSSCVTSWLDMMLESFEWHRQTRRRPDLSWRHTLHTHYIHLSFQMMICLTFFCYCFVVLFCGVVLWWKHSPGDDDLWQETGMRHQRSCTIVSSGNNSRICRLHSATVCRVSPDDGYPG